MALQIHEAGLDTSLASWIFLFSLIESLKMFAQLPTCWEWTATQGRLVCHPWKKRGCGELSEQRKQVWRRGSGMNGGGKE